MRDLDSLIGGTASIEPQLDADLPTRQLTMTRESYAWAQDCFWVMDNLGGKMTRSTAGSASRWALHQFARKNMDKFIGQIMPKAMALLDKALEKQGDSDDIVARERKNIAELKEILERAVEESQQAQI